jgi:SAM-dependent methyltransferase
MDRAYWDKLADQYDDQIFSSFDADQSGILNRCLDGLADSKQTVVDFGCGVGKYLPALCKRFGQVVGVDHSQKLLDIAQTSYGHLENLRLQRVDLSKGRRIDNVSAHVAVCANVLIMTDPAIRTGILRSVAASLKPGGHVVLVAPALESALLAQRRLAQWCGREGEANPELVAEQEGISPSKKTCRELLRGWVKIDGVPTKHYLAEELKMALDEAGLTPVRLEKVLYDWTSEFDNPPRWMVDPYPWDWLAVASKRK